jgi:hypothetical protein
VEESPRGSNRGPWLDRYFRAAHARPGSAWCGAFVSWVAREAGHPIGVGGRGSISVAALAAWGIRRGLYFAKGHRRPQAGDIAFYDGAHVGIVTRVSRRGSLTVVDGNWSNRVRLQPAHQGPSGYVRLPARRTDGAAELVAAG